MKVLPINKGFLLIGETIIFGLLIITYIPWENSNYNGLPNSVFELFLIKIFGFITLPTHFAFDNWSLVNENDIIYIIILLINIFLYSLVIERILSYIIQRIKTK